MKNIDLTQNVVKDFDENLKSIHSFNTLSHHEVFLQEQDASLATLSRKEKSFLISCNGYFNNHLNELAFSMNEITYNANCLGDRSQKMVGAKNNKPFIESTIEVQTFQSANFNKNSSYRAYYTTNITNIKTFHYEFETISHQRGEVEYFYDCLRINLNEKIFDIIQLKNNGIGFYIYECMQEQSLEEFMNACFSIQQAIGFINNLMVGNEVFIFDRNNEIYYTNNIRPEIKSFFKPITTNPHSFLFLHNEPLFNQTENLTKLPLCCLSKLVHKIHVETDFSTALLIIQEASSGKSLLIIPSSFAVVIELLSKHLNQNTNDIEKPIKNADIAKDIIRKLQNVIDENAGYLQEQSIIKLKRRINEINRPVNPKHLSNNEKLTRPFEQLGVTLSLHDIQIIEHRNDFFHGNIFLHKSSDIDNNTINNYLMYVSAKLYTLISKLILKSIGYEGYIYNQSKYFEKYTQISTDEEYFEKL